MGSDGDLKAPAEESTTIENPKQVVGETRIPLWLLSPVSKIQWALAQFAGLKKYGAWNWRVAGIRVSTYLSAIERHIEGYKNGEQCDPVDGTHHMGNVMACASLIMEAENAGNLIDDRPPSLENYRRAVAAGEEVLMRLQKRYADRHPRHYTIIDTKK